jgi:hypothetical protein
MLLVGDPFPFKIVFGIDEALRPAASAEMAVSAVEKIAIEKRTARRLRFTGDLQVVGV